jgi:large subunit ribosomal protein L15
MGSLFRYDLWDVRLRAYGATFTLDPNQGPLYTPLMVSFLRLESIKPWLARLRFRGHIRQRRSDMRLNELHDNPGATKTKKRIARGPGSGKGKTAGRGMKGQKSRSGVAIKGYEGGQMPLYQRLPKRGFSKPNRKAFSVVNLGLIQKFIDEGKLIGEITEDSLIASGLVRRKLDGVRILAKGAFAAKIKITVTGASGTAKAAVEAAGGSLTLLPTVSSAE